MSKELEALNEIKEKYKNDNGLLRRLNVIETALKKLEVYDMVEKLPMPKVEVLDDNKISYVGHNIVITDKEQFDKDQKKLKALEIIKEKKVEFSFLYKSDTVEEYNSWLWAIIDHKVYTLVQEEYELLKEVLL